MYQKEKIIMNTQDKNQKYILGAIAGDVIGSVFEFDNVKTTEFDLFSRDSCLTDDSILTFATMDSIINNRDFARSYQKYGRKYPNPAGGYGGRFFHWIYEENPEPYNSWGNGSAMRVSPVGWAYDSLDEVLFHAKRSAEVTHNHPEGIKGAEATASAIFLARTGKDKDEIKRYITTAYNYDLERKIDEIRPEYKFEVSCQRSVPEAIIAFLESTDYESAVRLAVSLGGDSDTIACITGGIAEAYYKTIPDYIIENVLRVIPNELLTVLKDFSLKYAP
jgi:ADP-ribosylglycohydrolase